MTANKKYSRRDFIKLSAVVASGAALTACGAKATPTQAPVGQPTATTAPPATEVIQIRSSIWGDARDKVIWDGIAEDFNAAFPQYHVTTEQYVEQLGSGSYYDKIKVGIASGTAPDAWYMQGFGWGPYADNKTIRPIDDLIARDNFKIPFPDIENYKYNSQWRGQTYLTPSDTGSVIMFYNKDVFDLFGVPYPVEGWTYEDFKDKAVKLSGEKKGTYYYGFANAGGWSGIYARAPHWLRKDGLLEWDRVVEPYKAQFVQDSIIEALQFTIVDGTNNKWCPAPAALQGGGLTIASGQVAMTYEGPWYLENMAGDKATVAGGVNYDVIHMPFGSSKKDETVAEIAGFEINIATKYVDAAWEWVKFQNNDKSQLRIAEQGRMCNLPDTINRIWAPLAEKRFKVKGTKYFAKAMETGRSPLINGEGADLFTMMLTGTPLGVAWDAMAGGEVTARQAMETANPECQQILDDYWAKQKK